MKLASILENQDIEKRIAITPEIAKKYINLGFNLSLQKNYGVHLGFRDEEYKKLGVNFLDQIRSLEILNNYTFKGIVYPILFLPFLSRASEVIGKKILFNFDENHFLMSFNINISSNFFKGKFPLLAQSAQVNFIDNKDNFNDIEWKSLYSISEETFVEESDSSQKSSAGAGLTDND